MAATVAERIVNFNRLRDAEKILLKYKAMRENSFRFLRGSCHLFYEDLYQLYTLPASPDVWLCGDLHLENFGSFKGSDKEVYFDINDFDEAILGPALYDVSRLLVSVQVCCNNAGYKKNYTAILLNAILNGYRAILQSGKPVTVEDGTATGLVKELLDKVALRKEKKLVKEKADKEAGFETLTIDNKKTFALDPSFKKEFIKTLQARMDETRGKGQRKIHDAAYLVAGTGSIGINRYLALATDITNDKKYLIVIKQAMPSSLQPFIKTIQPAWPDDAQRINNIQYRMQHITPGGLSTLPFLDEWFIIKWIQPEADKINMETFLAGTKEQEMLMNTLGCIAASAQLRSSGRDGSAITDELIEFSNRQDWIAPLLAFAEQYSTQAEDDFAAYCREYDDGFFNSKTV